MALRSHGRMAAPIAHDSAAPTVDSSTPIPSSTAGLGIGGIPLLAAGVTGNLVSGASTLALPALGTELSLAPAVSTMVVALFSAGFAASLVLGGRLGDAWGRRRVLRLALTAMVPASLLIAVAPGVGILLVARVVQGIACGLALPQVLSTIQHWTRGRPRARWTGAYAAVVGGGTALGQIGAGVLVTADPFGLGARLSLAGVALLALIVLATSRTIPESRTRVVGVTDPLGALLLAAAIITMVLPLGLSSMAGPGLVVIMLAFSAVLFLAFVLWQRQRTPQRALVPLPALRVRPLHVGLAQTLLFFAGYGGFTYYFSTMLQAGLDLGALPTSGLMMPFAGGFVLSSALLPLLPERMTPRRTMAVGALVQVLLLGVIAVVIDAGAQEPPLVMLCLLLTMLGIAQAAMYGPLIGSVMSSLDAGLSGVASGLFSTLQQVGVALGVPLFGLVLGVLPAAPGHAFALCVGVQVLFSAGFAALIVRRRGEKVPPAGLEPALRRF